MSQFSFDVFLSYAHEDCDFAIQMVSWLRQCRFRVWFDEEQLVPGSRFRAGLQQGLRESCHMVALLTAPYCTRSWTQRELDLFDLTADHSERRLLAVQIDEIEVGPLDQVVLVHQRISWSSRTFDSEGFWKLYCGLTGRRPGPRDQWGQNGQKLLELESEDGVPPSIGRDQTKNKLLEQQPDNLHQDLARTDPLQLVQACIDKQNSAWQSSFRLLRDRLQQLPVDHVTRDLLTQQWALGKADVSAVSTLALLPQRHSVESAWPFLDLACDEITNWSLITSTMRGFQPSEIWFSWAVCEQSWALLSATATYAPYEQLSKHFQYLASRALNRDQSFEEAEKDYDYGVMITPWNHFHLSWLAVRLGDLESSLAHAKALCSTTTLGDVRTGRFLNRLTTWTIFEEVRSRRELIELIVAARAALGLVDANMIPDIRKRLSEIWRYAKSDILSRK